MPFPQLFLLWLCDSFFYPIAFSCNFGELVLFLGGHNAASHVLKSHGLWSVSGYAFKKHI